ncbi:MAG: AMP-binding protein [Burkholderiales bacterium]|nr:AMP-binding protein [Burkholderiales bacterium]
MTPLETLERFRPHDGTLAGVLASRAEPDPERPFLLFGERTLSWGTFADEVDRIAAVLAGYGIGGGDRVATFAENRPEIVALLFAAAKLGAVLVPVNPALGVDEARYVFEHAGARLVAAGGAAMETARAAAWRLEPAARFVALEAEDAGDAPSLGALARGAAPLDWNAGRPGDTCVILYTSGTTGFPKGVMHAQSSLVLAGEGFVERMRLVPEDRLMTVLPLFHINALFYSLMGAVAAGASLVLEPRFSASTFWQRAAATGATQANIIAAVGAILARRPRAEFVPHAIRKVYGAPVPAEVERVFREAFGVPVVLEGYGMTEIPGVCNNPFPGAGRGENRIGSMGKAAVHPDPAVRFAELRVVDDEGRDVPDGEAGELAVRTPIVMQGYFRDPEASAAAFRDGWFLTGDLVRRDADGYFWFVARKKDIIRRRGENVSGAELDRVIGAHPDVAEAAAIGVASPLGEEDILVAVVVRPGARLAARDVGAWCAARLAPHKQPRYVVFVDALPHTPTLRVAKFRLKQDATLLARATDLAAP